MNTQEKIAVMQAFADGKQVQLSYKDGNISWHPLLMDVEPTWDWSNYNYRIAPVTHKAFVVFYKGIGSQSGQTARVVHASREEIESSVRLQQLDCHWH